MVTESRTRVTPTWRSTYFRICVLLLVSVIAEIILIVAFAEAGFAQIGLALSLLVYLISVISSTKMLLDEYKRSDRELQKYRERRAYFSIDMIAYATGMLGVVMRTGAPNYGHIYADVGLVLGIATTMLLAGTLVWASIDYSRSGDEFMLIIAFTLGWLSLIGSLVLLLLPSASSGG